MLSAANLHPYNTHEARIAEVEKAEREIDDYEDKCCGFWNRIARVLNWLMLRIVKALVWIVLAIAYKILSFVEEVLAAIQALAIAIKWLADAICVAIGTAVRVEHIRLTLG